MKRRTFIKSVLASGSVLPFFPLLAGADPEMPEAVWVENGEPDALLTAALQEMGGISAFIQPGEVVVIKPNMGWDRAPEYAANTNPLLIRALVKECYKAGAKTVKVFDRTCNNPRRCYQNSQIEKYASEADAEVDQIRMNRFEKIAIRNGKIIKDWEIYQDYLEADKIINVPIAKHHSLSRVTLGMKNLMGVMGGNRGSIHSDFDIKIVDITAEILPHLTIIDAYRVLKNNGPVGGNLADVQVRKTLIVSPCMVSADFLALELFGHSLEQVGYLNEAISRGLNKYALGSLKIKKVRLT